MYEIRTFKNDELMEIFEFETLKEARIRDTEGSSKHVQNAQKDSLRSCSCHATSFLVNQD